MQHCRVCSAPISSFMSFGQMPIANGFLSPHQFDQEKFFELAPAFCDQCGMVQLIDQPDPAEMFHENYAFFSRTSKYMIAHFRRFAETVFDGHLKGKLDPFVVELGSNDGIMLLNFKERGIRHLGVEPSANVAEVARRDGVNTLNAFFDEVQARKIVAENGRADAVLAANVMCHIPDLPTLMRGIRHLLKDDGVLSFEDPYLGDVIEKTSYDQLYDEHVFLFSAGSIAWAGALAGLELIEVAPQVTHGGSMRYTLAPVGSHAVSPRVGDLLAKEAALGLGRTETYEKFRLACEQSRDALIGMLDDLRRRGKRVVGYAATSKSTTVINYCGITPDHIAFISDTTPVKQGKFSPGMHIPVRPHAEFAANPPDYALLFAWNHKNEIMENEKGYTTGGGKWIVYVPEVGII